MRCCSVRCQMIILGCLIYFDFFNHVVSLITIFMNPYFGKEYGLVYAIILILYIPAIVLVSIFICSADSPWSRSVFPWGLLIAAVINLLLAGWIIIYITTIYDEPYIKNPITGRQETYSDEPDDRPERSSRKEYTKESKSMYLLWNTLFLFINGALFTCMFWISKLWVDKNAGRQEAQDED